MRVLSLVMLVLFALALAPVASLAQLDGSRNMTLLGHRDDYIGPLSPLQSKYSSCWSYIHSDGREYALIGTYQGTLIYNVTNPADPTFVGFIAGPSDTHREMKSYQNWIYIVSEGLGQPNPGIQILRMTDPDHPVYVGSYTGNFSGSHTLTVDQSRGLLICQGTRDSNFRAAGLRILSLADPEAPVEIGTWPGGPVPVPDSLYVHDVSIQGNWLHASSFNAGLHRVLDITNPSAPTQIAAWPTTPGGHATHSSWPSPNGNYLYECDEAANVPMHVFDISDPSAARNVFDYVAQREDVTNNGHVVHNPRVLGNELYLSCYIEGVRVLDISDPAHPAEFAWADSYVGTAPAWWYSVWEVCPYFPSGIVIASDMQTGLYVYRPVRDYGLLRVTVVAEDTGQPLPGASVYLTSQGDSLGTGADGIVQFGPSPGLHNVVATKAGYLADNAQVSISAGVTTPVTLILPPNGGGGGGGGGGGKPIYEKPASQTAPPGEDSAPKRFAFRVPAPNPAPGRVTLILEVPVEQDVRAEILDAAGRLVREIHAGRAAAGLVEISWDGNDASGHVAKPGIYFVQAFGATSRATARVVRIP